MQNKPVFAIDAGSSLTGWAILENVKTLYRLNDKDTFGKTDNYDMLDIVKEWAPICTFAIEYPYPKGAGVAQEVFDMTVWLGRFIHVIEENGGSWHKIYRHREKSVMCRSGSANDSQIRASVIDLFGGKGTKDNPGPTFGIKADIWQAIAVGVTFIREGDSSKLPAKPSKLPPVARRIV